jgi:hypothetical protein
VRTPTFGVLNFTSALADCRRYFMPAPLYAIAARAMHYGRYGAGGQDERLFPLFVGYPTLVRGYDVGTFDSSDCMPSPASNCPALDRMVGSRMLMGEPFSRASGSCRVARLKGSLSKGSRYERPFLVSHPDQ